MITSASLLGGKAKAAYVPNTAAQSTSAQSKTNTKDRGGLIGGVGYLGEKAAAGLVQSLEGIVDFGVGGIADLLGADAFAERQFKNDWFGDWYDTAGDWYNPSRGWKVAGDIAGGIGTSLPSLAVSGIGIGIAAATGGAGTPLAVGLIAGSTAATAGLSAAGTATKEAYRKSGNLGLKEYGYGALVGITEGAIEGVSNAIGVGTGAVVKSIAGGVGKGVAKGAAKGAGKAAFKSTIKSATASLGKHAILKTGVKAFAGEAFEEGVAELLSPFYARMTYDPEASLASPQEIAYAAFVGGMSGLVMGGATGTVNMARHNVSGNQIYAKGQAQSVVDGARALLADAEKSGSMNTDAVKALKSVYDRFTASAGGTSADSLTGNQRRLLGEMNEASAAVVMNEAVISSAINIVQNAEQITKSLEAYNYTDENGNKVTFTAEQLREGILGNDGKIKRDAIATALKNNTALRTLAAADAAGRLMMDTTTFADAMMQGTRVDEHSLNAFIENASEKKKAEVGKLLGVSDWNAVDAEEINARIGIYMMNGGAQVFEDRSLAVNAFEQHRGDKARAIPSRFKATKDGVYRYSSNGDNIAVSKYGATFAIYDYDEKVVTRDLSRAELNRILAKHARESQKPTESAAKPETVAEEGQTQEQPSARLDASETAAKEKTAPEKSVVARAREIAETKVKGYEKLSERNKSMVRKVIRQGIVKGVPEELLIDFANVSAHAKVDVVFDKDPLLQGRTEDGREVYANGAYDPHSDKIYINPDVQTSDDILIHELDHAIRKTVKGGKVTTAIYAKALKAAGIDTYEKIADRYLGKAKNMTIEERVNKGKIKSLAEKLDVVEDEVEAYYAQTVLGSRGIIKHLVSETPSLKQRILDFFKGAKADYRDVPNLDRQAAKYYRQYKKWFDEYAGNRRYKTMGDAVSKANAGDFRYSFAGVTAKNAEKLKLSTAEQLLSNGVDSETVRQETGWFKGYDGKWRFEIDDSAVEVAFNGKFSRDPDVRRYAELVEKAYFLDTATKAELEDLIALDKKIGDKSVTPNKLGDLVKHPALFSAYPQLQDIEVYFHDGKEENASYHPGFKEISIAKSLKRNPKKFKQMLLHEVQHAVQDLEGFSAGSNPDMFNNTAERSAFEQYRETAGEIEARDVSNRIDLTNAQRKNTRPDIDRKDVIFNDEGMVSYFAKNDYDPEIAGIKDQIKNARALLDELDVVFSANLPQSVGSKREAVKWATAELKKHGFRADRQGFGEISFSEKEIDSAMRYLDTNEERVSIIAIYYVLKRGIKIGEHGDHKGRGKHTVTFGAPVEMNGKRGNMAVVVNMRNKSYYAHRIVLPDGSAFKFDQNENADQELQRGVPKRSLANATRSASALIIPDPAEKINPSDENSSKKSSEPAKDSLGNTLTKVNPDMRMSLPLDGEEIAVEVEERNELIAVHNLSEANLNRVLDIGGFPMPSIAVTAPELSHSNYGDISVVFGRETIDPEATSKNVVYDRDAWTPTAPRVDVKLDTKRVEGLTRELESIVSEYPEYKRDVDRFFDGNYRDNKGDYIVPEYDYRKESIGRRALEYPGLMAGYLLEQGKEIKPIYKETTYDVRNTTYTRSEAGELLEYVGITKDVTRNNITESKRQEILEKLKRYRADQIYNRIGKDLEYSKILEMVEGSVGAGYVSELLFMSEQYFRDDAGKKRYDAYATREKLQSEITDNDAFETWVFDKIQDTMERKGIKKDVEVFDSRGRRKTFAQTHDEYNVENIVKAMSKGAQEGNATFGMTAGAIAANLSRQFKSVEDIRQARKYLKQVSEEDLNAFKDKTYELYDELVSRIAGIRGDLFSDGRRRDEVGEILGKCAKVRPLTVEGIKRKFDSETRGYDLGYTFDDAEAEMAMTLFETLKHVPTTYFEAKPRRVVNFSEIKMVELPYSASEALKAKLSERRIPYEVYGKTDAERSAAINRLKDVSFSLPESDAIADEANGIDIYTEEQYNNFGWARYSEALMKNELDDLYSKLQEKRSLSRFKKSARGEAIVEVNDKPRTTLGVDNVFVFVKGTEAEPEITRVIRFNAETDIEMEIIKEVLYERGTWSDSYLPYYEREGITKEYRRENSVSFERYQQEVRRRSRGQKSRGADQDYRKSEDRGRNSFGVEIDTDSDRRYSRPLTDENGNPIDYDKIIEKGMPHNAQTNKSVGTLIKHNVKKARYKVYSKKDMLALIDEFDSADILTEKTRNEFADAIWKRFNTATSREDVESFADDAASYIFARMMREAKVEKNGAEMDEARARLSFLQPYLGRITFTESDIEGIEAVADKDGLRRILGRWGNKGRGNARAVPMDVFVTDISRENAVFSSLESEHVVDAFLKIDAAYDAAKATVDDKWESAFYDRSDEELFDIFNSIKNSILVAYEYLGEKTEYKARIDAIIAEGKRRADYWKAEHDKVRKASRWHNIVANQARRLRDLKTHKFANATQVENDTLDSSIGQLSNILIRGNISVKKLRSTCASLLTLYQSKTFRKSVLEYYEEKRFGYYNEWVEGALEELSAESNNAKALSVNEFKTLSKVISYFINFYESYGKVLMNGKRVEALPLAQSFIDIAHKNAALPQGKINSILSRMMGSQAVELFSDPASVVRRADLYDPKGFFTTVFEMARRQARLAEVAQMRVMKRYDAFLKENKGYMQKASKDTVEIRGQKITKIKLISLWCTSKRKQAQAGLVINGYQYTDLKGNTIRVDGELDANAKYTEEEIEAAIVRLQKEIEPNLTEKDKQYIAILEDLYNNELRQMKVARDMERYGFTNATDGYYYTIRRAGIAQSIDVAVQEEIDRVSNASFNKDVVKGARQELFIESADALIRLHVQGVCQYAYMSSVVDFYNGVFNLAVNGNRNHPISVKNETQNAWKGGNEYFRKLMESIQGISKSSEASKVLSTLRGGYAISALGANPKVLLTQLSSFAAASAILDPSSIAKGLSINTSDVDKYCDLAELRVYENTAAMAQAVVDGRGKAVGVGGKAIGKTQKIGQFLMTPIGLVDRAVIRELFGACQVQVQKDSKGALKIGTERNKVEAGKLLEKVIYETQQNSLATEKSTAMRSSSEILKALTMFSSDAMKITGRVVDAFGEIAVLKERIASETDADAKKALVERLKVANKTVRKAVAAMLATAAYMTLLSWLFRHIYNKEEEETVGDYAKTYSIEFFGNLIGGMPLIRDAYSLLTDGYEIDHYAYSAVNDILTSFKSLSDTVGSYITGEGSRQDLARNTKALAFSVSQVFGLPLRNVYNFLYGMTKRFRPDAAYKIDSIFYEKNYANDLTKALEDGDTDMSNMIYSILYNERVGVDISDEALSELHGLAARGYKVMPRKVASEITLDGVEYALSGEEQAAIQSEYARRLSSLDALVSSSRFQAMTDEEKEYAAQYLFDICYKSAEASVLGIDRGNAAILANVISADKLTVLATKANAIKAEGDERRKKTVAMIKAMNATQAEKLIMICLRGYSVKDGDIPGVTAESAKQIMLKYILSASVTKAQKEKLAKMCGFTVKDGKILQKSK